MQSPGLPPQGAARRSHAPSSPGTSRSSTLRSVLEGSEGIGSAGGHIPCPIGQTR